MSHYVRSISAGTSTIMMDRNGEFDLYLYSPHDPGEQIGCATHLKKITDLLQSIPLEDIKLLPPDIIAKLMAKKLA